MPNVSDYNASPLCYTNVVMSRPLAVPNSPSFLHLHSKQQDTEVVFIIPDTSYSLLFCYMIIKCFLLYLYVNFPSYCSLLFSTDAYQAHRDQVELQYAEKVSTSCDSAKLDDSIIIKHRKQPSKRHSNKKLDCFLQMLHLFPCLQRQQICLL